LIAAIVLTPQTGVVLHAGRDLPDVPSFGKLYIGFVQAWKIAMR